MFRVVWISFDGFAVWCLVVCGLIAVAAWLVYVVSVWWVWIGMVGVFGGLFGLGCFDSFVGCLGLSLRVGVYGWLVFVVDCVALDGLLTCLWFDLISLGLVVVLWY